MKLGVPYAAIGILLFVIGVVIHNRVYFEGLIFIVAGVIFALFGFVKIILRYRGSGKK